MALEIRDLQRTEVMEIEEASDNDPSAPYESYPIYCEWIDALANLVRCNALAMNSGKALVNEEKCNSCAICIRVCPIGAISGKVNG
jgi:Fe-S-cluster-containing hydrogenase component 2